MLFWNSPIRKNEVALKLGKYITVNTIKYLILPGLIRVKAYHSLCLEKSKEVFDNKVLFGKGKQNDGLKVWHQCTTKSKLS